MQGGASDLYGSGALGGVVNLTRRPSDASAIAAEASYGSQETRDGSLFASLRLGNLGIALSGEAFRTDGYVAVEPDARGAVDTPVASRSRAVEGSLRYELSESSRLFSRSSYFDESRDNGTPLQKNDTRIRELLAGGEWATRVGSVSLRASGGNETFRQTFSAVTADRQTERLTGKQDVSTSFEGASLEWRHDLGGGHVLLAGADWRLVRGTNDEERVPGDISTLTSSSARQEHAALFAEDLFRLTPRLTGTLALRVDAVLNSEGTTATAAAATRFPDRSESLLSPRLALTYAVSGRLRVGGSVGRSFRSPTLNELYRSFRVGNVQTLANENLVAERALGGDVTARANPTDSLSLRAALFLVTIEDPVANVTLQTTPALITRQRRNLGRTRSSGVEVGAELRLGSTIFASGGYAFVDSRVTSFPADAALEGNRVPQVPRHQATLQLRYEPARVGRFGVQARFIGDQFDDDQNRLRLASFFALDVLASRPLVSGLSAFAAVENLFDRRYEVGRTPVLTIGPPRAVRFGLRFDAGN